MKKDYAYDTTEQYLKETPTLDIKIIGLYNVRFLEALKRKTYKIFTGTDYPAKQGLGKF